MFGRLPNQPKTLKRGLEEVADSNKQLIDILDQLSDNEEAKDKAFSNLSLNRKRVQVDKMKSSKRKPLLQENKVNNDQKPLLYLDSDEELPIKKA